MTIEGGPEQVENRYVFDTTLQQDRQRIALQAEPLDPGTFSHIEALGVREGWRCLEVAGGGGSVAEWLARRVGTSGMVVATDLDTRFMEAIATRNLEVRQHNILTDGLETGAFDLVHTRLLLEHLTDPPHALRQMVAALKPGGWLLVEDWDCRYMAPGEPASNGDAAFFREFVDSLIQWLASRGVDVDCGRRLLGWLQAQGLAQVTEEGRVLDTSCGSPYTVSVKLGNEELRSAFVASGLSTDEKVNRFIALLDKQDFSWTSPLMVAAWGQRPAA